MVPERNRRWFPPNSVELKEAGMAGEVLGSERGAVREPQAPAFDHNVRPWMLAVSLILIALVFLAFFVYGQVHPGA